MRTLSGVGSNVTCRMFNESFVSLFLCIKIVYAFFHSDGTIADDHEVWIISVRCERKHGQRLKQITDIWSSGHGRQMASFYV